MTEKKDKDAAAADPAPATTLPPDAPNDAVRDELAATFEGPPNAADGVDPKPAADGVPESGPNLMNTVGLTPAQAARVNGTVLDGQLGGAILGIKAAAEGSEPFRPAHQDAGDKAEGRKS